MSKVLLDTCTFLWLETDPKRLPVDLIRMLADRKTEIFLSAVSAWEIVLKLGTGKLTLPVPPREFVETARSKSSIQTLAVEEAAVLQTAKLPALHKDPFDRMLIGQAIEHGLTLATPDPLIRQYAVRTVWDKV